VSSLKLMDKEVGNYLLLNPAKTDKFFSSNFDLIFLYVILPQDPKHEIRKKKKFPGTESTFFWCGQI
jgi:hypothetical protein